MFCGLFDIEEKANDQLILRVNEPFQMEQEKPLRTGPWEEPTSLPESREEGGFFDPLLPNDQCLWML